MTAIDITLYHNPRCGKSRAALALLQARGVMPTIVEYLKTPLDAQALTTLVERLGIPAEQLIRKGEDVFKEHYAGKSLTAVQWIQAMVDHPILMERPIIVRGTRAVIGRPPENALELL